MWVPIKGFERKYSINSHGEIRAEKVIMKNGKKWGGYDVPTFILDGQKYVYLRISKKCKLFKIQTLLNNHFPAQNIA